MPRHPPRVARSSSPFHRSPRPSNGLRLAHSFSSHFTARLGRRTACGSHIHFRAISPLASAVERPAARTFIFEPFHRSPRPSNGLRLALPPPRLALLEDPPAVAAQAPTLRLGRQPLWRLGQRLVGEVERPPVDRHEH